MDDFDIFRLDGRTLRVFVTVYETGSISRTAELFDLNQSTISHTVDKMRAAVGDPLFVKSGRGITPTEKAIAMVSRVQWILSEIEGLVAPEHYVAAIDDRPFVIAIPTPALLADVRTLFNRLLAAAPNAELHLRRLAPRDRLTEMLVEDEADLAISVTGVRYPSTLNHCAYGSDALAVFYDPDQRGPINTLEDYLAAKHGVVNFGGSMRSLVESALAHMGRRRQIGLVAPTASMLGDLVRGTEVVVTMPRRIGEIAAYRALAMSPPPIDLPRVEYDLVWHRRYENSARNLWLRGIVREVGAQV